MDLLDAVLIVGATLRLTRLAVVDTIAAPFRTLVLLIGRGLARDRGLIWADELVSCPHCIGFWIAVAVVASWAAWGGTAWWNLTAGALTVAYASGHLVARLDVDDEDS